MVEDSNRPGDIVESTEVFTQNIKLKGAITGSKGDILVPESGTSEYWTNAATGNVNVNNGWAQSRVDYDTTGKSDGDVAIEALVPPSAMFLVANQADIIPEQRVMLLGNVGAKRVAPVTVTTATPNLELLIGRMRNLAGQNPATKTAATADVVVVKTGVI